MLLVYYIVILIDC